MINHNAEIIFSNPFHRHFCPRSCYPVRASTCYKQRVTDMSYSESTRLCGLDRRPDGFRTDALIAIMPTESCVGYLPFEIATRFAKLP